MHLVFITQVVDSEDPVLGATVAKLRALAKECDRLDVICGAVGKHDLPTNVSLSTFAASRRAARGARFTTSLVSILKKGRPDGILAHMCPIYLILAAPLAKPLRVPLLLWYTHWSIDRELRMATPLSDAILSVESRSFPLENSKIQGIGHGIDIDQFTPVSEPLHDNGRLRLLGLGRTAPWKGFMTLLEALELAYENGLDASLELRSPSVTQSEKQHRIELQEAISRSELRDRVRLEQPVPRTQVPDLIRAHDALVNPTREQPHGAALDKVVYEASACGVPVIASNPQLDSFLSDVPIELRFRSGDAEDLSRVLTAFAGSDAAARKQTSRELRRRVEEGHSVATWAERVVEIVQGLR